jgi:hypothetical protein
MWRQEDHEFEARLDCIIRHYLKKIYSDTNTFLYETSSKCCFFSHNDLLKDTRASVNGTYIFSASSTVHPQYSLQGLSHGSLTATVLAVIISFLDKHSHLLISLLQSPAIPPLGPHCTAAWDISSKHGADCTHSGWPQILSQFPLLYTAGKCFHHIAPIHLSPHLCFLLPHPQWSASHHSNKFCSWSLSAFALAALFLWKALCLFFAHGSCYLFSNTQFKHLLLWSPEIDHSFLSLPTAHTAMVLTVHYKKFTCMNHLFFPQMGIKQPLYARAMIGWKHRCLPYPLGYPQPGRIRDAHTQL